jgi:hypothetical protein
MNNKTELVTGHLQDANCDLNGFCETWMKKESATITTNKIDANDLYHILNTPRSQQKTISDKQRALAQGGGLTTFISKNYSPTTPKIIEPPPYTAYAGHEIPLDDQKLELQIIRAYPSRLPRGYTSCIIINVYLPEFVEAKQKKLIYQLKNFIEPTVSKLNSNGKPLLFILGDFNGANVQPLLSAFSLYQINNKPTNKLHTKCLDILLSNAPKCYNCTNRPPFGKSDHDLVLAFPNLHKYKETRPKQRKILARSGKIADTVANLRIVDWSKVIQDSTSTQEAHDKFYSIIKQIEDYNQPLKIIKVGLDKPWMTQVIKEKIKMRQIFFFKSQIGTVTMDEYSILAKEIAKLITFAKLKYNRRYTTGKPDYWKAVKEFKDEKSNNTLTKDEATTLNLAFYNVWNGQKQQDLSSFIDYNCPKPSQPILNFNNVNQILKDLKSKSKGPDDLSPTLL